MTNPPPVNQTQLTQLGAAILSAQRFEFYLYGIAAHVTHLPEAQKDRRLRELNGEKFLRGDPSELKMTLGQLSKVLGEKLMLDMPRLQVFIEDRNLIAHNFYRTFHTNFRGAPARSDPEGFLSRFVAEALWWNTVIEGLFYHLSVAIAQKEGPSGKITLTEENRKAMAIYEEQAANVEHV